ncbi:glycerophosphoryl diester phosphodiesterase membrane domain-containing protein [Nocardiopsis ganjiahuensis]|uniref:glycerophosphoryl diester phosphodiesterase membrane domain-containing protein n=1 Tax=Nocardiopsis ganjiahuensis TaxID=239984 RepID=UPI0003623837|nr:glycerophosphoryl diester phosphodiesterase membrane domain-containing protein [Nocardiopsis ganjiahuensis]
MSQEDDHRERPGDTPDSPEEQGSPASGDTPGAGGWAAPGQGSADTPAESGPTSPQPGYETPGQAETGYGTPAPPPGYAPRSGQEPQGYGPQGYGPQGYGPQGPGGPSDYSPQGQGGVPGHGPSGQNAPGYGPPPGYGAPGYGPPGHGAPGYGPPPGYGAPGQGTPPGYGAPGGPSGYGAPGQGGPSGYGAPGYGEQGPRPQPIKPGVVALRPMSLGDIFNGAFSYIRDNPRTTFVLSLLVMAIASIVSTVAATWLTGDTAEVLTSFDEIMADPAAFDPDDPMFQTSPLATLLGFVGDLILLVGGAVLLGLLAAVVGMAVLGYRLTIGQAWEAVRGRIGAIIGLAFIKLGIQLVIAVVLVIALFVALFLGLIVGFGAENIGAGIAVGLLLLVVGGLIVGAPALWIWIRLYYAMPLVVLERLGPGQAIARSWRLSRNAWWRTLGYWLLALLIVMVVNMVLGVPVGLLTPFLAFNDGLGTFGPILVGVITYVVTVLIYALTQPFVAGVNTLLYIDLRMRHEGLDLQLHQIAQRGQAVGPEIYLPGYRT